MKEGITISRIVILGGNGFLGQAVGKLCAQSGVPVLSTSSRDIDLASAEAVTSLQKILRPDDTLLFISALTPDRGRDLHTLMKNVSMAYHVAQALERSECRQLTYISSDAVYSEGDHLICESSPCDPQSLHGIMHITREKILGEAMRVRKLPYLIVRPCALYGAGDPHNSYGPNRFMKTAQREGQITLFGEGAECRDHLHVDDCAMHVVQSITQGVTGVVNSASGDAVSFRRVAEIVAHSARSPIEIKNAAGSGGPVIHRHFDTTKLARLFPRFSVRRLESGIAHSIESY